MSSGTLNVTFSDIPAKDGTPTVTVTGDRPQLVPATGPYNTATNSFDIRGTATGFIAGFRNVQARYQLTLGGANLDTVTGTYQVGLNRTLNDEPDPITYRVTGRITNKTFAPPNSPVVTAINTAGAGPVIAQNGWIEIHGTNLVPASTPAAGVIWSAAPEFAQGRMPTTLGGVSVTVNGKPAFVYYFCSSVTNKSCTSDQINVLTPLDTATGSVPVVVTSANGVSPAFSVPMQAAVPSFLQFSPEGYVVATHANNSLAGPETLYPGASTPAKPGEPLVFYGVGFGLPSAPLVNGSASQSGTLSPPPVCAVGGVTVPVAFAGLIGPGLYQLNMTMPAIVGTREIACTYKGVQTAARYLITVQP